ncbi:hypothetical protein [Halarcobacter sp.]|uniref:hypothetical protein n=1 Tax=Halarcobacter sp. TaxID=2321133 RepID=UPI003B0064D7
MIYIVLALITVFFSSCSSLNINFPKEEVVSKKVLEKKTVLTLPSNEIAGDLLVYRPDSKELISTVKDNLFFPVYIWDMQTKTLRKKLDKKEFKIANYSDIIFSDDSKKLLFSSQLNLKKEYDFKTRKRIYRPVGYFGEIYTENYDKVIFHKYNDMPYYEEEIIDTVFGKRKVKKKVMASATSSGDFFELTSDYLITTSYFDSSTKMRGIVYFDRNTFKVVDIVKDVSPMFLMPSISPNKKLILIPDSKKNSENKFAFRISARIYDIDKKEIVLNFPSIYKNKWFSNLSFLDDNHLTFAPVSFNTKINLLESKNKVRKFPIKLINIHTKKEELFYEEGNIGVNIVKAINNKYLISYSLNKSLLLVWDRKTRKTLQKIEFGKRALGLTISPDKREIAISYANKIYLYKVNSI